MNYIKSTTVYGNHKNPDRATILYALHPVSGRWWFKRITDHHGVDNTWSEWAPHHSRGGPGPAASFVRVHRLNKPNHARAAQLPIVDKRPPQALKEIPFYGIGRTLERDLNAVMTSYRGFGTQTSSFPALRRSAPPAYLSQDDHNWADFGPPLDSTQHLQQQCRCIIKENVPMAAFCRVHARKLGALWVINKETDMSVQLHHLTLSYDGAVRHNIIAPRDRCQAYIDAYYAGAPNAFLVSFTMKTVSIDEAADFAANYTG